MRIAATISMASRLLRENWVRKPLTLGAKGEAAATKFLRKKGYILIGTNVRTSMGEIDLVAVDGRTVVFVEVKTRESDGDVGHPAEAVDQRKQDKLTVWARHLAAVITVGKCCSL
ncbi:MAG: YraN family protein [Pirellulaceae bacterium]